MSRTDPPFGMRLLIDPVRIWVGGIATALVAAGVAWGGVVGVRAIFNIPAVHRFGSGEVDIHENALAGAAALFALLCTALLHLLLISTPQARRYFVWIIGLFIAGMIIEELLVRSGWLAGLLTSAVYLVAGAVVALLLSGVARMAIRYVPDRPESQPDAPGSRYHSYPGQDAPDQHFRNRDRH